MTDTLAMKQATEALWHVDNEFDQRGWDQPASLLIVERHEAADDVAFVTLSPLPGWATIRTLAPNVQAALHGLCRVYADLSPAARLAAPPRPAYFGLALVTEAWLVRNADCTTIQPPSSVHPHRIEVRVTHLAAPGHPAVALIHERDGIAQMHGPETATHTTGAVVDLLDDLATAVQRVISPHA